MQSFPSTFTRNKLVNSSGNTWKSWLGTDFKSTMKNVFNNTLSAINKSINKNLSVKDIDDGIDYDTDRDYNINLSYYLGIDNHNQGLNSSIISNGEKSGKGYTVNITNIGSDNLKILENNHFENVFNIPVHALASINKYNYIYKYTGKTIYENHTEDGKAFNGMFGTQMITPSLFNPWFGVPSRGFTESHTPLSVPIIIDGIPVYMDGKDIYDRGSSGETKKITDEEAGNYSGNFGSPNNFMDFPSYSEFEDISDCTIKKLVELSNKKGMSPGGLGRSVYKYADFMYCKDLGKVSNNHLITLRKFGTPVGDNILHVVREGSEINELADEGRLISWFNTDDNKLEDICKYDYNASWKKIDSELQDINSEEDKDKLLPSMINIIHKNYLDNVRKGVSGNNAILKYFSPTPGNPSFHENEHGEMNIYFKDPNKVYEPRNTTRETHVYEGKLSFNQEITLNFSYKLRYYNGINPKSAMLDLLANILEVTYKRGRFWGGGIRWIGPSPNTSVWNEVENFEQKVAEWASSDGIDVILEAGKDIMNAHGNNFLGQLADLDKKPREIVTEMLPDIATMEQFKDAAVSVIMSGLKNKLGRPHVYAIKKIYTDEPVGLWHLTVGNPRNPILSIGNLILTNANIQHSGPLGIDDFPTELKVTVTLKHGRPRDIEDIYKMYTQGLQSLYTPIKNDFIAKYWGKEYDAFTTDYTGMYSKKNFIRSEVTSYVDKEGKIYRTTEQNTYDKSAGEGDIAHKFKALNKN